MTTQANSSLGQEGNKILSRQRSKNCRKSLDSKGLKTTLRLLLLLSFDWFQLVESKIDCINSKFCENFLHFGSECIDGYCTNPLYQGGCLHQYLPGWNKLRVCNSEDPPEAEALGYCQPSEFADTYQEIRIYSQNWESVFFEAWILQILLSEILQVPTTIETGVYGKNVNLYDRSMRMDYGLSNDGESLRRANDANGDCTIYAQGGDASKYQSCSHVIPEVWNGQRERYGKLKDEGVIDPLMGLGSLGHQQWFIPEFVAREHPTLLSYFGLSGEDNRQKLADIFKLPTTWKDYCEFISADACLQTGADQNDIAKRPPQDEAEEEMYFLEGLYDGYFRNTPKHNCTLNPTTCGGVFIDFPCGWSSFAVPQTHYNNIPLEIIRYSYGEMIQIVNAANFTKSPIIFHWWTPEILYQQFVGTDFEFHRVSLHPPTQDCIENRITTEERCSDEVGLQIGDPLGSCDEAPHPLHKVLSKSLYRISKDSSLPVAAQSPAYDAVAAFEISDFQTGKLFDYWLDVGKDMYSNDGREGTCKWAVENIELIQSFVPRSFPRVKKKAGDSFREEPIHYAALSVGLIAFLFAVGCAFGTYHQRERRVFKKAQLEFLWILLIGVLMVAVAAVLLAIPATDATCVIVIWLFNVGYTLELVPLIVKIAAINRLVTAAQQYRRVKLRRKDLFGTACLISSFVVIFCFSWTMVDPPQKGSELTLTNDLTDTGETIVSVSSFCQSESDLWRFISVAWNCLLLTAATVLAFQTRNVQHDINETHSLAILIYSHFFFVVLRVMTYFLEGTLGGMRTALFRSFLLSGDICATLVIYFMPKLLSKDNGPERRSTNFISGLSPSQASPAASIGSAPFNSRLSFEPGSKDNRLEVSDTKYSPCASIVESHPSASHDKQPNPFETPNEGERIAARLASLPDFQSQQKNRTEKTSLPMAISEGSTNGQDYVTASNEMDDRTERLVKLNCIVMKRLLKRIIAKADTDDPEEVGAASDAPKTRLQYDLHGEGKTIVGEVADVLRFKTDSKGFKQHPETIHLSNQVIIQLENLVSAIASMYHENPYHNFELASHITQSAVMLFSRIVSSNDSNMDYVWLIQSDPLVQFAAAFSALICYIDHSGLTDNQLVEEKGRLAGLYNNESITQQNAADLGWTLLMSPDYRDLQDCIFSSQEDLDRFRQLFINATMTVDTSNSSKIKLQNERWESAFQTNTVEGRSDDAAKATRVFETLAQAANLSYTMQHWQVYIKWNEKLFDEVYTSYLDGRMEENPFDFWYEKEITNFDEKVMPLTQRLSESGIFGTSGDEYSQYAKSNRDQWVENGEQILTNYLKKFPK